MDNVHEELQFLFLCLLFTTMFTYATMQIATATHLYKGHIYNTSKYCQPD